MTALDQRVIVIRDEYRRRKAANASYSLRAFARDLGSSPSSLSQIISGKRPLTRAMASSFASRGVFSAAATEIILERKKVNHRLAHRTILSSDKFELISSWQHFAVLTLTRCFPKGIRQDAIIEKIGEHASVIAETCERLVRLGLLRRSSNGLMFRETSSVDTGDDVPSQAIKRFHSERLLTGRNIIEKQHTTEREFSSVFFNMREQDFVSFREELRETIDRLVTKYTSELPGDCFVYNANTQVFKVSKRF